MSQLSAVVWAYPPGFVLTVKIIKKIMRSRDESELMNDVVILFRRDELAFPFEER